MGSNDNLVLKSTMVYGLILGSIQAVIVLFSFLIGIDTIRPPIFITLITYTAVVVTIVQGTKKYRDDVLGGAITYGKAFWYGVLICVFAGMIYGVYMVIHVNLVDANFLTQFMSAVEEEYRKIGFNDKEITDAMNALGMMQKPLGMVIFKIFELSFMGLVFSLFISIFTKRKNNTF